MHLQAWDPYYFSPFGVETRLWSYSLVGYLFPTARFFFIFAISNIPFVFSFLISYLSRSYIFHSYRINLAGPNFVIFSLFFISAFVLL